MHVVVIVQPQDDCRIGCLNEVHTARWALRPRVGESFRKRGRDNLVTFSCIFLADPRSEPIPQFTFCELRLSHRTSSSHLTAASES